MELEVTKKVRLAIKAKLLELGVHVDEELPDYIMILIANRRTKVQMEDDLSLFLGDNTLKFTSWLFQVLKKLEEVTATVPISSQKSSSEDATTSKTTTSTTPVKKTVITSEVSQQQQQPEIKEPVKTIKSRLSSTSVPSSDEKEKSVSSSAVKRKTQKSQQSSGIKSPVSKKSKASHRSDNDESSSSPEKNNGSGLKIFDYKDKSVSSESLIPKKLEEEYNSTQPKTKVSSSSPKRTINRRSKSPITAPSRSVSSSSSAKHGRSRSPILSHTQLSSQVKTIRRDSQRDEPKRRINRNTIESTSIRSSVIDKTNSSNSRRSNSRSRSLLTNAGKSLKSLVAVVKRNNEINSMKDEKYNPSRPAVTSTATTKGMSSVVHVTERPKRATKQQERGSNNLLVRALADAQKSIVSHSMQTSSAHSSKTTDEKELKDTDSQSKSLNDTDIKYVSTSIQSSSVYDDDDNTDEKDVDLEEDDVDVEDSHSKSHDDGDTKFVVTIDGKELDDADGHSKSIDDSDTKFVVTMDNTMDSYGSDSLLYHDDMETDEYILYSPDGMDSPEIDTMDSPSSDTMDLRRKISRTVIQSIPSVLVEHQQHQSYSPITSSGNINNASSRAYLPITGPPPRPAAMPAVGTTSTPACKYWPDCTFKDKCVYPHPKCKYGQSCTKANCPYKHDRIFGNNAAHVELPSKTPNSAVTTVNESDGKVQCKFFPKCHSMSCTFYHPSPCRFELAVQM